MRLYWRHSVNVHERSPTQFQKPFLLKLRLPLCGWQIVYSVHKSNKFWLLTSASTRFTKTKGNELVLNTALGIPTCTQAAFCCRSSCFHTSVHALCCLRDHSKACIICQHTHACACLETESVSVVLDRDTEDAVVQADRTSHCKNMRKHVAVGFLSNCRISASSGESENDPTTVLCDHFQVG